MEIEIRNQANIPNKYLRFAKWKIRKIKRKFDQLLYTEIFISKEGSKVSEYKAVIRLGIPGNDIILTNQDVNLKQLWSQSMKDMERYLRKHKEKFISSKYRHRYPNLDGTQLAE